MAQKPRPKYEQSQKKPGDLVLVPNYARSAADQRTHIAEELR